MPAIKIIFLEHHADPITLRVINRLLPMLESPLGDAMFFFEAAFGETAAQQVMSCETIHQRVAMEKQDDTFPHNLDSLKDNVHDDFLALFSYLQSGQAAFQFKAIDSRVVYQDADDDEQFHQQMQHRDQLMTLQYCCENKPIVGMNGRYHYRGIAENSKDLNNPQPFLFIQIVAADEDDDNIQKPIEGVELHTFVDQNVDTLSRQIMQLIKQKLDILATVQASTNHSQNQQTLDQLLDKDSLHFKEAKSLDQSQLELDAFSIMAQHQTIRPKRTRNADQLIYPSMFASREQPFGPYQDHCCIASDPVTRYFMQINGM